jgi:peptidoglycan/LPS O-acetylase OafA/YrhL
MDPKDRFIALDGLRGIAAICVVVMHGLSGFALEPAYLPHAQLAVDFFFMLSAFVIANAYTARMQSGLTVRGFLSIRWIRLFPLYAVGLAIGIGAFAIKASERGIEVGPGALIADVALGLAFLPTPLTVGSWLSAFPFNPPAWSLFFEWMANLAWATALFRLRASWIFAFAVVAGLFFCRQALALDGVDGGSRWTNLGFGILRVAFPFLVGLFIWSMAPAPSDRARTFIAVVLSASLVMLFALQVSLLGISRGAYEAAVVCLAFPLIVYIGARVSLSPSSVLGRAMTWLGNVSYAVYVVHYPLVRAVDSAARSRGIRMDLVLPLSIVEAAFALLLAYVLVRFWDVPVRLFLSRRLLGAAPVPTGFASRATI